jgi:hypothetical protein
MGIGQSGGITKSLQKRQNRPNYFTTGTEIMALYGQWSNSQILFG